MTSAEPRSGPRCPAPGWVQAGGRWEPLCLPQEKGLCTLTWRSKARWPHPLGEVTCGPLDIPRPHLAHPQAAQNWPPRQPCHSAEVTGLWLPTAPRSPLSSPLAPSSAARPTRPQQLTRRPPPAPCPRPRPRLIGCPGPEPQIRPLHSQRHCHHHCRHSGDGTEYPKDGVSPVDDRPSR